jgi:hypothetical protein
VCHWSEGEEQKCAVPARGRPGIPGIDFLIRLIRSLSDHPHNPHLCNAGDSSGTIAWWSGYVSQNSLAASVINARRPALAHPPYGCHQQQPEHISITRYPPLLQHHTMAFGFAHKLNTRVNSSPHSHRRLPQADAVPPRLQIPLSADGFALKAQDTPMNARVPVSPLVLSL